MQCYRTRELTVHCNSVQRSCAVDSNFCLRCMQLCRTKLCSACESQELSLLALYAVPHTECVVLYNEVVQLIVISACVVCSLVESRGFFTSSRNTYKKLSSKTKKSESVATIHHLQNRSSYKNTCGMSVRTTGNFLSFFGLFIS